MKFITCIFLYSLSLFVFTSCNSGSAEKHEKSPKDSVALKAPFTGEITFADSVRLHNDIAGFYQKYFLRRGFNGAILVAKKGHVVFEDYHGSFNLSKKDTLTAHSPFHLASVSKTFTAMAVVKLNEMGKVNFSDDIRRFFPSLPYENITVHDLLTHRSALPNYIYFMHQLGWDEKMKCTNRDVLEYLIKFQPPLQGTPGKHFTYCNTNYSLLALIIERASGMKYPDFLEKYFFEPLHMEDTYVYDVGDSSTAMPSFDWRGRMEGATYLDYGYGDKNIYSTPRDLLKWDQALYTNLLFKPEMLEAAYTPYSNEKPGVRNYGYGWRMNVYPDGRKIIYHNGWWHGNNTVFIRMIQDSVTIIVLGNKYNRAIYDARKMIPIFQPTLELDDSEHSSDRHSDMNNEDPADSSSTTAADSTAN